MSQLDGIHLMSSREWGRNDADVSLFCDASSIGLGFWFPAGSVGFQHGIDPSASSPGIFYHEALSPLCTGLPTTSPGRQVNAL